MMEEDRQGLERGAGLEPSLGGLEGRCITILPAPLWSQEGPEATMEPPALSPR